jgi:tetratricopeptide (TPR) repeat protein
MLVQSTAAAHHLGQIHQRLGQTDQAIHAYQLALAISPNSLDARERLAALSAEAPARAGPGKPPSRLMTGLEEEVSKMRTKPVPGLPQTKGMADFLVLFSAKGIEDVQFASGDEALKPAAGLLRKLSYEPVLPDGGAARIPRRGILSCSAYTTPNCNFTLLPPSGTTR